MYPSRNLSSRTPRMPVRQSQIGPQLRLSGRICECNSTPAVFSLKDRPLSPRRTCGPATCRAFDATSYFFPRHSAPWLYREEHARLFAEPSCSLTTDRIRCICEDLVATHRWSPAAAAASKSSHKGCIIPFSFAYPVLLGAQRFCWGKIRRAVRG